MKTYGIHTQVNAALKQAQAAGDVEEASRLKLEDVKAVAAAVKALQDLHNEQIKKELERFHNELESAIPRANVLRREDVLSSFASEFWHDCFVDLFFRGDCQERVPGGRPTKLPDFLWAKCLLSRHDNTAWRTSLEFVASLYNILLRRSQMRAVHFVVVRSSVLSQTDMEALAKVTAKDFIAEALTSGDCDSLKDILRRQGLDHKLHATVRAMDLAFRRVRGSDTEKSSMRQRFIAMRVWNGFSSLFFTLNPHDIRSPITLVLADHDRFLSRHHAERFSLELGDAETEAYLKKLLGMHPRLLHEIAVQDPVAATRCFHYTVRLVVQTLFHCAPPGSPHPDGLPCETEPGIFGHIAGYLGVVEPQMRKALHIHMLIQLHGFAHPRDLFADGKFVERFKNMWYFVASICFRSTEAYAAYIGKPSAFDVLSQEPLLPITPKQRGMLGKERADDAIRAQLQARGLSEHPQPVAPPRKPVYYVPRIYQCMDTDSSEWAAESTRELCAATRKSGSHVCRSDVCHKGKLGRTGFCRMSFWHWVRGVSKKGEVAAVRAHGLQLQRRWGGMGPIPVHETPPSCGAARLETVHPFHIKMTPGIYLGPRCNHDLGVLLRFPVEREAGTDKSLSSEKSPAAHGASSEGVMREARIQELVNSLTEELSNSEFYCSVYASKEQPHVEGLMLTLARGVRDLDNEIAQGTSQGDALAVVEKARRLLHRLVSSTNRRMHKGFPEMLSYLLRKPSWYCSHEFCNLFFETIFQHCCMQVLSVVEHGVDGAASRSVAHGFSSVLANYEVLPSQSVTSRGLDVVDYIFRAHTLENMPWYYFMSSCIAVDRPGDTLKWFEGYTREDGSSFGHPCRARGAIVESRLFPGVPLRLEGVSVELRQYSHFHRLRTHDAWHVPMLRGRLPRKPDTSSTDEEKGRYGLFLMLLLRPWRGIGFVDFIKDLFCRYPACRSPTEAWHVVADEFTRWQASVEALARPLLSALRSADDNRPPFGSEVWWSCLVYRRLQHLDLVLTGRKHLGVSD